MSRCLNLSGDNEAKFNELVKAVGRKEAVREFLEAADNDRPIGTPIQVKEKIRLRTEPASEVSIQAQINSDRKKLASKIEDPMFQDPETAVGLSFLLAEFNNESLSLTEQNRTQAIEIVGKLSAQTGVAYNIVSTEEAMRITANTANPYNGSKAGFFFGGQVYFVSEKLNTKLAFHEFSHPIIRAIRFENPELFEKLYQEAILSNPEYVGQALSEYESLKQRAEVETDADLRRLYGEDLDNAVKEEVLVKALTEQAMFASQNLKVDPTKKSFFTNLLYNIRQFLRKLFGSKINISKLDGSTSMADLAQMLAQGDKFQINTQEISDDLIVAYFEDQVKYVQDMRKVVDKVGNRVLLTMMKRVFEGAANQIKYLQSSGNYTDLVELLTDEFNRGDLQQIKSNLSKYTSIIDSVAEDKLKDIEVVENEVTSFVNSMIRLDFAIGKIQNHLKSLEDDTNDKDTLHKVDYYSNVLNYWDRYIQEFQKVLDSAGADSNSPLNNIVSNIRGNIRKASDSINTIQTEGVADVLWDSWKTIAREGDRVFEDKIKRLKESKTSDAAIEKEYIAYYGLTRADLQTYNELSERLESGEFLDYSDTEKYESLRAKTVDAIRVTKEKIEAKLKGEGKDASWANSFLEGYLYNTDPVIGGFAMYYKNNLTEVDGRIKNRLDEIAGYDLKKLLSDAGINSNNIGESGKTLGFVDTIGHFNAETGEFTEKKIWSLLQPHKNHRYVIDKFNYDIRQLEKQYRSSGKKEDHLKMIDMIHQKEKHLREWFYQEYDDQYYKDTTLIQDDNDTIGKLAQSARDQILEDIRMLNEPLMSEYQLLDKHRELELAWRKYRLLYSTFNADGTKKKGDDLLIAKRLQEYRDKTRKYYEFKERPGVFQNALQDVESEIKSQLVKQGYTPGHEDYNEIYNEKRDLWIKMNTRVVIKPKFYEDRAEILERIKKILSKLPSTQANEIDFTKYWEDILDSVSGYRDDDGQPLGHEITEGRKNKIREAQEAMERAKEAWAGFTGLTREQYDELNELSAERDYYKTLPKEKYERWVELLELQESKGLSKAEIQELNNEFAKLKELQGKEPTEYYLDQLNSLLEKMDLKEVYDQFGITSFDQKNMDLLYTSSELRELLFKANPQFETWFNNNHIEKKVKGGTQYERLYVWNVIRPNDPKYYETTNILDEDGNKIKIPGLPKMKFYARVVKKEFRTGYDKATGKVKPIVGIHIDNRGVSENGWLPKIKEGSPYINEEYFRLKNADPNSLDGKKFKALEALTKIHLKSQEGLPRKDRLYLDFPRFEMSNLEMLQSGRSRQKAEEKMSLIRRLIKKFLEWIRGQIKDDPQYNYNSKLELVRLDAFGDQIDNIPIQGLYNLDYEETSTDVVSSIIRYMMGAEQKKQLLKMNPTAKALKNVLEKNEPKDMEKASFFDAVNRGVITYANKGGKYVRRSAIQNFYDREFLGQKTSGFLSNQKWLINLQNFMFKRAAFSFFTFNPTSDIKNQMGAKFQAMIEAAAGENLTYTSLAKGQVWASKYMFDTTASMYDPNKRLSEQIGDVFDFQEGRFRERADDPYSRTVFKDVATFRFLQGPRKFLEVEAASQTFAGMMYKKKVSQNGVDIDYMDAWELDASGIIKLKEGIDIRYANTSTKHTISKSDTVKSLAEKYNIPEEDMKEIIEKEWKMSKRLKNVEELEKSRKEKIALARDENEIAGINKKYDALVNKQLEVEIDNNLFKLFRNKVQAVMQKLTGAYSSFAQPEAQRWILWRFISFMRRFFTTMFVQRFGKRRWNPGYGQQDQGYYVTFIKGLWNAIKNLDPIQIYKDKEVFAASLRVLAEVSMLLILDLIIGSFGFDLDDEDKYEKLRQMSGPLPIPFVAEDNNEFDLFGWLGLHTLNLAIQIRSENEQLLPLPKFGLDNLLDLTDIKSIALGPTLDSYQSILGNMLDSAFGNERAFYKRRAGAYEWQQQGSRKIWNMTAKMFGINATFIDPASAITNLIKAQNLSKI